MSFVKNLYAKYLYSKGLNAQKTGQLPMAVDLMEQSSDILWEMISEGEDRYEDEYARTKMNLGLIYHKLGKVDDSICSFQISILKFKALISKGRTELLEDLTKAETEFKTLYGGGKEASTT
jgi:tetratricopeptide (TPR) repeat protein